MCGIGGILRLDGRAPERQRLEAMRSALDCRGPDACGIYIDGPCGMVHTRLAVIDPAGGHQPMVDRDVAIVFNGEIYNHRAVRAELKALGQPFTTDHSDTEVLLRGYRQWGADLAPDGMFALAIWDAAERQLMLMRDRCGKKPLYIWHRGHELIFASTVAAMHHAVPESPRVNQSSLVQYLAYGYNDRDSLYEGISQILPGESMVVRDGGIHRSRYWRWAADDPSPQVPSASSRGEFEALLDAAVERRLEADVPLGCFLSGGIDSSLIAAIAQKKLAAQGERLRTFSMSMPDVRYDEGPFARRVAEHIGSDHHELRAEPDVERDLVELIRTMGEPFADSSILPTYWLSRAARRHVTVALSGDGGDELFGGYERYVAMRLLRRHGWWLRHLPVGRGAAEPKSFAARFGRLIEAARQDSDRHRYDSIIRIFTDAQLTALGLQPQPPGAERFEDSSDAADAARRWDVQHYLPGDLLCKVDRASMAVALEVRCPMLDTALADLALATPMRWLMPGRRTKAVLRRIARPHLPADVIERKKMGFAVPIGHWFRGELRPMLYSRLLDGAALTDLGIHRDAVERLITEHTSETLDHTHRLFALLSLAMAMQETK